MPRSLLLGQGHSSVSQIFRAASRLLASLRVASRRLASLRLEKLEGRAPEVVVQTHWICRALLTQVG